MPGSTWKKDQKNKRVNVGVQRWRRYKADRELSHKEKMPHSHGSLSKVSKEKLKAQDKV